MKIFSLFLFVFLMMVAFFNPAAAEPSPSKDQKNADYDRHIFKKRDVADFDEEFN
jgi:hypothetical protein